MREAVLPLLVCPQCAAALQLRGDGVAADGHIMSGALSCASCSARYPIRGGVPYLVAGAATPAAIETADRFGAQWKAFNHLGHYDERWLRAWLDPITPADFAGKLVYEAGCGKGRHTRLIADWGAAAVVAVDLGDGAFVAFDHTRALPNVHVVQADLVHPPVARVFDIAFSIGVLDHIPEPRRGFDAVVSCLRPDGRVAIWVYGLESNEWIVRYINPVRESVTARLPPGLLYWLSLPPSALLKALVSIYRIPGLASRLPYGTYMAQLATLPLREVHNIVFDQLVTPIAHYLREDEVRAWFARGDLDQVRVAWHNRNSWRASAHVARSSSLSTDRRASS